MAVGGKIKMFAEAVIAFCKIQQLPAQPRQSRDACQLAHAAGHLPAMLAVGERRTRLAHCPAHPWNATRGAGANEPIFIISARMIKMRVVAHTRPTTSITFRMRPTITSHLEKSREENIIKGNGIVVKFTSTDLTLILRTLGCAKC